MKYDKTHPWIKFSLRLDPSDRRLWMQLGEAASKCEHLSGVPLRPEFAMELNQVFLAKGALATTAIEGNTLTEEQALEQVRGNLELPPSQDYLKQEMANILSVYNKEIKAQLKSGNKTRLRPDLIKSYNKMILHNLELEEDVNPGKFRTHSVVVGSIYRGAPAEDCPYLLDKLCEWLNGDDFKPPEEDLKVPFALVRAIVAHVYLAWIHPFGDGNGRAARMVEFHTLFSSGIPLPAAHLLSDHYNRTRTRYYQELDRASKSGGDLMPFIRYAVQGFLDGIREQLNQVRVHQMVVAWENYIHERFKEKKTSPTQKRRRDLVLELSRHDQDWVPLAKIEMLTPGIAKAYATAGNRMLQRDLNALEKMDLITREYGKVKTRKHAIQAFLPARVRDN